MRLDLVVDEVARPWQPAAESLDAARRLVGGFGPVDGELQVVVTDDATLREHNRDYRDRDQATDVLSFSYLDGHNEQRQLLLRGESAAAFVDGPLLPGVETHLVGQLLISIDTVRAREARAGRGIDEEVVFLMAHGLLHVLGFDHAEDGDAEEMEALEQELMASLGNSE